MKTKPPPSAAEIGKFKRLAATVVEHHLGTRARSIKGQPGGLTNFVFAVKHERGNFVLRISPEPLKINSFLKEQWAQKAAREAGIPVPEILEVGLEMISYPYMISTAIEGVAATDHPMRSEIVFELGRIAASINKIRTRGFGETFDWTGNQLSRNASFGEYLEEEYCYGQKLAVLEKHDMLPTKKLREIKRVFKDAAGLSTRPVLNHGDMRLKNVIVDAQGKIMAIIDWEGSTSNIAPQWEISIALHDLGIDEMQRFIDGYGLTPKRLKEIMPLAKAFNIANYAAAIDRATRHKRLLSQYRVRLSGALDLYSL